MLGNVHPVGARPPPGEKCVAREMREALCAARCSLASVPCCFSVGFAGLEAPPTKKDMLKLPLSCVGFGKQNHTDKISARDHRAVMIL